MVLAYTLPTCTSTTCFGCGGGGDVVVGGGVDGFVGVIVVLVGGFGVVDLVGCGGDVVFLMVG